MNHSSRVFLRTLSIFVGFLLFPHLLTAQPDSLEMKIKRRLDQMSLDQKVGQLFIFGFPQDRLTSELSRFLQEERPGAFILFKRNISDLNDIKNLNEQLYSLSLKYSGLPPLLAVDQEGGSVARISTSPPMPNALAVGQTNSPQIAQDMGAESARVLKDLGFNMNLAPVLDVSDPFHFSFIGVRSFGSDPKTVGEMGFHFSKGLILGGVIPTGKHFPGTGSSNLDPHQQSVQNTSSQKELLHRDLPPFQSFSRLGFFSALMISQFSYPHLDKSGLPAVFSSKIITQLLRQRLKFRGLIVTDDLQMSASKTLLKPEEAALAALKAGSDLVMLTWSFAEQKKAVERVKKAVRDGEFSLASLNDRLKRIIRIKYYLPSGPPTRSLASMTAFPSPSLQTLDDEILNKNLESSLDKKERAHSKLCVFSSSYLFLRSFKSGYSASLKLKLVSAKTNAKDLRRIYEQSGCDQLVFTVLGKKTAGLLAEFPKQIKNQTVVANLSLPGLIQNSEVYRKVLNVYFPHRNAGKKIAQLLSENYAISDF